MLERPKSCFHEASLPIGEPLKLARFDFQKLSKLNRRENRGNLPRLRTSRRGPHGGCRSPLPIQRQTTRIQCATEASVGPQKSDHAIARGSRTLSKLTECSLHERREPTEWSLEPLFPTLDKILESPRGGNKSLRQCSREPLIVGVMGQRRTLQPVSSSVSNCT